MALRAVSIVSLEGSIRSQFDERLNEIQRSIQEQQATSIRHENQPLPQDNLPGPDTREPDENEPEPPDMTSDGDLGQSQTTQNSVRSFDIRVEYDVTFPDVSESSEDDDSISESLREEINRLSGTNNQNMTCCRFYKSHWIGHLITAVLCGSFFVLLGVIFVASDKQFPVYAGVILIVLGLAPCCMALNKYRYARLYERERRRAIRRLRALRLAHRRNMREAQRRNRELYPDLPPTYDNLGFNLADEAFDNYRMNDATTVSSETGSFALPTYEQCVKKEDEESVKHPSIRETESEDSGTHTNAIDNGEEPQESEYSEIPIESFQNDATPRNSIAEPFEADCAQREYDSGASLSGQTPELQESSEPSCLADKDIGETSI